MCLNNGVNVMTEQEQNIQHCFPVTRTSFCINGDEFDLELLKDQLRICPTVAWKKGEFRHDHGGNRYYQIHPDISAGQYSFSHWRYSTEYERVSDIKYSISLILEKFVPLLDILIKAKAQDTLSYQISIAMKRVEMEKQLVLPAMILPGELIAFADKIGAEISFDLDGIIC